MIDKLELRLPASTMFRPEVEDFMHEGRLFTNSARTMGASRYTWVTDLRPLGIDALLHYRLRRDENAPHAGEHKLEMLDTGLKGYSELAAQLKETIDGPTDELEVMRIDLCADIYGTPVEWFLSRLRIRHKRIAHEVGSLKYQRIGKAGIQTLSGGKRPNIVRVYDKVAEYKEQLRKLQRKRSRDADELTLASEFGVSESSVITRVERQYGGGRIPPPIATLHSLQHLPKFNPFTNLEIRDGAGAHVPTIEDCGLDTWLAGTRLRQVKEKMGEQQFRRWLSTHSSGNSARIIKRYHDFLYSDVEDTLTVRSIFEIYRDSVRKQLAA